MVKFNSLDGVEGRGLGAFKRNFSVQYQFTRTRRGAFIKEGAFFWMFTVFLYYLAIIPDY